MSLVEVVSAAGGGSGGAGAVHRMVHGTDDAGSIAAQLDRWCRQVLGSGVADGMFHSISVGSVTGVTLTSGEQLVVKAYQPRWSPRFLESVGKTQRAVAAAGVACAVPVAGPHPLGMGLACAETYLADPGQPASYGPAEMAASAIGLAELVDAAPWADGLRENPLQQPAFDGLYPTPHSPLFDFEATAAGAEWIDAIATEVRPLIGSGPEVVAHTDWSARNVRLRGDGVVAVYDMDSLAIVGLNAALAIAAATWRSTGEPGDALAPGVAEIDEWLGLWPMELTDLDREGVFAHAAYALAYTARCEHAVDPDAVVHRRARPTLRSEAAEFLRRAGVRS